jgi:hypothetical protein
MKVDADDVRERTSCSLVVVIAESHLTVQSAGMVVKSVASGMSPRWI